MKFLTPCATTILLSRSVSSDRPLVNTHDSLRRFQRETGRSLVGTNASDTTGVICSLANEAADAEIKTFTIPFYYAVGASNNSLDDVQTFDLQQKLFHAVEQSIPWCYEDGHRDLTVVSYDGQDRRVQEARPARRLGILAIAVGPTTSNIGNCSGIESTVGLMNSTGANLCQLNEGSIRVTANAGNTLDYMSSALRDSLRSALNVDRIWNDWRTDLSGMSFLLYVGDSLEEIQGAVPAAASSGGGSVMLYALGIPIILLLLLLGFIKQNKDREQVTSRDFHDMMNSEFVLAGTGDPPASFHEGLYHYMRDGTRYLSTNCEGCLETRRNSFFTDDNLGTIMEDTEFEENVLRTANSKQLGKRTSTMAVHKCTSATCKSCLSASIGTTKFIPAGGDAQSGKEIMFSEV